MATESFEKTNWGWQIGQLQQRVSEWWELQTSQLPAMPRSEVETPMLGDIVSIAIGAIAVLVCCWMGWRFLQEFFPYFLKKPRTRARGRTTQTSESMTVASWLQRSRKFQQQGNYREACRCLYLAMLQRLNDTQIAPHQLSRTDGEYLQLIPPNIPVNSYQILLKNHEEICFGNADITWDNFEQCQRAYREIERGR